jgi:hypothetical protein
LSVKSINFAKTFIKTIRTFAKSAGMITDRLPKWITFATIRIGRINNTTIFLFEESVEYHDTITFSDNLKSDIQFFLGVPEYTPEIVAFKAPSGKGLIILEGEYGEGKSVVFDVYPDAIFNAGYVDYHSPIAIINIFLNLKHENEALATRFIPFAIYINDLDLADFGEFWQKCTPRLQNALKGIYNSSEGDYYQKTTERKKNMLVLKEKSVIVFGKDSDQKNLLELCQVRDYLRTKNYEAYLLKELPEHPLMSNEEKARFWALASRFCVMIDQEASGHIAEYAYLGTERVVLAFLRLKGKGSTYMIGDDSLVERNNIKLFEYESSPLQSLDDAIVWAEEFIGKKIIALKDAYPWRGSGALKG